MLLVNVGSDHDLILIPEQLLRQLHPNLMSCLRRNLSRFEALLQVIRQSAALFVKTQLGTYHLVGRGLPVFGRDKQIHAGDQFAILGFLGVHNIPNAPS